MLRQRAPARADFHDRVFGPWVEGVNYLANVINISEEILTEGSLRELWFTIRISHRLIKRRIAGDLNIGVEVCNGQIVQTHRIFQAGNPFACDGYWSFLSADDYRSHYK